METQLPIPEYLTLSEICRTIFGSSQRQVRARAAYAIECSNIPPVRRVGTVRLWHRDDVPRIQAAVDRITTRASRVA